MNGEGGQEQITRQGRGRSGRLPFGYRTEANPRATSMVAGDRSSLIEHTAEQELLQRILALRREGLGPRRIAPVMNVDRPNPRTGRG